MGYVCCLKAFNDVSSQLVSGATNSAPTFNEIPSSKDPSFIVEKLSSEQRKEKINRYLKKRKERTFGKKIKVSEFFRLQSHV